MRNIFLGIVSACVFAPSAFGVLTLNIDTKAVRPGESGAIEVFFTELPPAVNERLALYALGVNLQGAPGVTFGQSDAEGNVSFVEVPTEHPWVFSGIPGSPRPTLEDLGTSTASQVRAFGELPTRIQVGVDITNEKGGVLRIPFSVAPGAALGLRQIVIEQTEVGATDFVDDAGELIPFIANPLPTQGILVVPEPAALSLLGIGGVLFLRRRRA